MPFIASQIALILLAIAASTQPITQGSKLDAMCAPVQLKNIALGDAIDFIRDRQSVNLVVNWKMLEQDGIDRGTRITAVLDRSSLRTVLQTILRSADPDERLVVNDIDEVIYVTTKSENADWHVRAPLVIRGDATNVEHTKKTLAARTPEINLAGIPLSDALDFISDVGKVKIQVDWQELAKLNIDKNAPITLCSRGLTVDRVIRLIIDEYGLGYGIEGDHAIISSRDALSKK